MLRDYLLEILLRRPSDPITIRPSAATGKFVVILLFATEPSPSRRLLHHINHGPLCRAVLSGKLARRDVLVADTESPLVQIGRSGSLQHQHDSQHRQNGNDHPTELAAMTHLFFIGSNPLCR